MSAGIDFLKSCKFYYIKLCADGYFMVVNDHFSRHFSFSQKNILHSNCAAFIHPGDHGIYYETIKACLKKTGEKNAVGVRMRKDDESYFLTDWEFSASIDGEGNITGVEGVGFPHTGFAFERSLSNSSGDGILLLDKHYKILAYNKPAENFSLELYKKQYLTGDDFRNYVREEARVYFNRQFEKALNGIISEEIFDLEKSREKIFLKVQMMPVFDDVNNAVSGVAIVTKDITLMQSLNNRLNEITAMQSHQIRRPVANMLSLVTLIGNNGLNEEQREYLQLLKVSVLQLEEEIQGIVKTARNV